MTTKRSNIQRTWAFGKGKGPLLATSTALASLLACSSFSAAPEVSGDAGGEADAAADQGLDNVATGVPEGCDPLAEPKDSPACVDNGFGVFVDATNGADSNPGTRTSPVKSIKAALGSLAGKPRVYVCAGSYAERVELVANVSLYGGFSCGDWRYDGSRAKVAPSDGGYALEANGVHGTVADLELVAAAGAPGNLSSVAVLVANSAQLTFTRVKVEAAAGFKGGDGADAVAGVSTPGSLDGMPPSGTTGGPAKACTCSTGGTSKGGQGGDANGATDGTPGETAQVTPTPVGAIGHGGSGRACTQALPESAGFRGSDAPPADAAPAPPVGALDPTGWHPGNGAAGTNGTPAQGGGGGGGSRNFAGGGGGGCGGCGGGGGGGGSGGGASIALISIQSTVTLQASVLLAGQAGAGGTGKPGMSGGTGGTFGTSAGCNGGTGGTGGSGGAGAGGAGGISVGVLFKGVQPTLDVKTTVTPGGQGAAGTGGAGNDGPAGVSAATLEMQ